MRDSMKNMMILKNPSYARRLRQFTDEISQDAEISAATEYNPLGVVAKYFSNKSIKHTELTAGNRLIANMLSNDEFLNWTKEYNSNFKLSDNDISKFDRSKILSDFTQAVIDHGDKEILSDLLNVTSLKSPSDGSRGYFVEGTPIPEFNPLPGGVDPTIADTWAVSETFAVAAAVVAVLVVITAIDFTPRVAPDIESMFSGTESAQILTNVGERIVSASKIYRSGQF